MSRTKDVPHGTRNGYIHYHCRCDECRGAHAAYFRTAGKNLRVGSRAATKRRADENLKHPCESCGQVRVFRAATLCLACHREQLRETRRELERRWQRGETLKQIAAALETTVNVIGVTLVAMRRDGRYDVPRRPPGGPQTTKGSGSMTTDRRAMSGQAQRDEPIFQPKEQQ